MLNKDIAYSIITSLAKLSSPTKEDILKVLKSQKKSELLKYYKELRETKAIDLTETEEQNFLKNIRMKQIRTMSGVTTVTVLTKPFPCPGKCIFCPNDVRMPKSYLSNEPGAQRAEKNKFDPYYQTYNRLMAIESIGHPTDKIELIILGGTWTAYTEEYRIWFVLRCFQALNDFSTDVDKHYLDPSVLAMPYDIDKVTSETQTYNQRISQSLNSHESSIWEELFDAHKINETAKTRCVGLVIETRPDEITEAEVINIRKLGATKVQLGVQSLDDKVLALNKRGHNSEQTAFAFKILRKAGFKIHAHYMPNLYGSTPENDILDYQKLFSDPRFCPDEVKIYPCSLIAGTELMNYYNDGTWKPYTEEQLLNVLSECFRTTPRYCRITRMIRDIPGTDIVEGNKKTNFRQLVELGLKAKNIIPVEIRSREVQATKVVAKDLLYKETLYKLDGSVEYFLEYDVKQSLLTEPNKLAGFLRLSLSDTGAIIREIHVYGQSLALGSTQANSPQHLGLGKKLINKAKEIVSAHKLDKVYVISSVGTREYYRHQGFTDEGLYQVLNCKVSTNQ